MNLQQELKIEKKMMSSLEYCKLSEISQRKNLVFDRIQRKFYFKLLEHDQIVIVQYYKSHLAYLNDSLKEIKYLLLSKEVNK